MNEKIQDILNYILFTTGTATAAIGLNLSNIDLWMSLFLKFISLVSFICFLLINQDLIHIGWVKFKSRFKHSNKKRK